MIINRVFLILWVAIMLTCGGSAWSQVSCTDPVETSSGLVRGTSDTETGTCVWRGIPYAAPPVGELRWKSPQPHPFWSGVRDATEFGARCMQKDVKGAMKLVTPDPSGKMSEDCLFMNIWRPAKSGRFPVMVWIHGGGYLWGTANTEFYWGDRLAEAGDVVVVTFNYRLDIFGFFAHPALMDEDPNGATGGQGSLDQVAAIKWVHENIEAFGGDPDNLTIFGESAGGYSICTMIATPLTEGLFHKAIMQSGGCDSSRSLEAGYKSAREAASKLGCDPDDLDCLRDLPAEKVLFEGTKRMTEQDAKPHHDGYLLTDTPINMIRSGNYNHVPFMAGYNRDEAAAIWRYLPEYWFTRPAKYKSELVDMGFDESDADRLVELYPLGEFNNKPARAYGRMFGTDTAFGCPSYQALSATARQQEGIYFYRFDFQGFTFSGLAGAAHGMEIPFVFNSMDRAPTNLLYNRRNIKKARELSGIIQGYWLNFAKTGNPNGPGLPAWPQFKTDSQTVQVLDLDTRSEPATVIKERYEYWQELGDREAVPGLWDSFK